MSDATNHDAEAELRRLRDQLPGCWWAGSDDDAGTVYCSTDPDDCIAVAECLRDDGDAGAEDAAARFIAAAHTHLPALLDRLGAAERERDKLRERCARTCDALAAAWGDDSEGRLGRGDTDNAVKSQHRASACRECAAAIRGVYLAAALAKFDKPKEEKP